MPRTILNGERPPPPKLTALAVLHQRRTLRLLRRGRTPARIVVLTAFLLLADLAGKSVIVLSLQDAPYFYDGHVNVRMDKGRVVLQGFVFSDWDLRDAVRIATRAAKGKRVINDLGIVEGGRR